MKKFKKDLDELRASTAAQRRYSYPAQFMDPAMHSEDFADDDDLVNRDDHEHYYCKNIVSQ